MDIDHLCNIVDLKELEGGCLESGTLSITKAAGMRIGTEN